MSRFVGLRALLRLAARTAKTSPLRSLLVATLIAVVVAAGIIVTTLATSAVSSQSDRQAAVLGDRHVVAVVNAGPAPSQVSAGAPLSLEFNGVAEPIFRPGDDAAEAAYERALDEADRWHASFDAETVFTDLGTSLQPSTSLAWTRGATLLWADESRGPFGGFGDLGTLLDITNHDPVAAGQLTLIEGRLPERPGEVALDIRTANRRPHADLGAVSGYNGVDLNIVGIVLRQSDSGSAADLILASDFDRILEGATLSDGVQIEYRMYPAPGWTPADAWTMLATMSDAIGRPIDARIEDTVWLPTTGDSDTQWVRTPAVDEFDSEAAVTRLATTFATALFSVQIALVAAAAVAVGVRRRAHHYALVGVTGGSADQIRTLVLAEAFVLGLTGVVTGIIGAIALLQLLPIRFLVRLGAGADAAAVGFLDIIVPAGIGLGAALLAAWWPARTVAHSPPAALLGGRIPTPRPGAATVGRSAVLLGVGAVLVAVTAASSFAGGGGFIVLLASLAIATVLGGAVLAVGPLLSFIGRRADRLPVLARLVVRDSDRGRSRSWVATGALVVLAMLPILIGSAILAYPASFGGAAGELDERIVTVRTRASSGDFGPNGIFQPPSAAEITSYEQIDQSIGDWLDQERLVAGEAALVDAPNLSLSVRNGFNSIGGGWSFVAATDELIQALDLDLAVQSALDDQKLVNISHSRDVRIGDGTSLDIAIIDPTVTTDTGELGSNFRTVTLAGSELVPGPARFSSVILLAPDHELLAEAGTREAGTVRVLAEPVTSFDETELRRAANAAWAQSFPDWDPETQQFGQRMELAVERDWRTGPTATETRTGSLLIAGALSLLVAMIMATLAAVELDHDLSAMVAAGAPPGLRRRFLGLSSLYHMVLAAVIGVPLAIVLYWVVTRSDPNGPTGLTIPWLSTLMVLVVLPILVAIVIALGFRSGRPSVSRRAT